MRFTDEEISLARKLRDEGLSWEPAAGHYVYDETGFCKQPSPFQDRVYFILNYSYFMKAVGGVERFKEMMIWLPTWYDAREILRKYRVPHQQIHERLSNDQAIERGIERLSLYELIASRISAAPDGR